MVDEVIAGLRMNGKEVKVFRTHDMDIQPCTGCGECETLGRCVIEDMFQDIFDQLIACDGVVFASPLYFMNVPARGKALIDRCQAFWAAKYRLGQDLFNGRKRPGLLVSCAGARYGPGGSDIFRGMIDTMTYVFDVLELVMMEHLFITRVDAKGEITEYPEALAKARKIGMEMSVMM